MMFDNFNRDKLLVRAVMFLELQGMKMTAVDISELERDNIPEAMYQMVAEFNPDAYIVISEVNMLLTKGDTKKAEDEIAKAGSIANVDGSTEGLALVFESRHMRRAETYEIIRAGDDVVINENPILETMQVESVFSGYLFSRSNLEMLN